MNKSMPSVLESLNSALHQALSEDRTVYIMGEDIIDPYGGAFKVTQGLSTSYPERVLTTPISEAGFVGLAAGMAMRGLRPVVEIMFGDFIALIADQLINHIAKFRWVYNDQVRLPMVIRTPMGGRRGYGPTHSQSLEKFYLGLPGLNVVAPAAFCASDGSGSPGDLLYRSIVSCNDPLLFIENKLQYLLQVQSPVDMNELTLSANQITAGLSFPVYKLSVRGAPKATLTMAAYGYMAELAKKAVLRLAYEREVFIELLIPTQLSPFDVDLIASSVRQTGALLVVEEGTQSLGWGAEVIARVAESMGNKVVRYQRLAASDLPIPCSGPLEAQVLPDIDQIIVAALQVVA